MLQYLEVADKSIEIGEENHKFFKKQMNEIDKIETMIENLKVKV